MGMDIYGVNPKIKEDTTPPERPKDLHNGASDEVVRKYFKQQQAYEDKNPGVYFRNNVWWWRPLANFISEKCDWLTQEQKERLHDNSGFEFSEHEAVTIADTLQKMVDDGTAAEREEVNKREMEVAEAGHQGLEQSNTSWVNKPRKKQATPKLSLVTILLTSIVNGTPCRNNIITVRTILSVRQM